MSTNFNRYEVDAQLTHRHAQIRNDFSPSTQPQRHLSMPKLPSLPKVRFRRPAVTA